MSGVGPVLLRRRFGYPGRIDAHERVWLVGEGGHGPAGIRLPGPVLATNLAGRTLRDLVLGQETELTSLTWTNREVKRWEPEPLRWLGVKGMYGLYRLADRREAAGLDAPSRLARFADGISGR